MTLNKKNAVITGCASGIGFELLALLLKNGCKVVACDRQIEKLELPSQINTANLFKTKCDISLPQELDTFFILHRKNLVT